MGLGLRTCRQDPWGRVASALSVDHLSKRFGDRVAFDAVPFEVGHGEVFGFLGPDGAGKTTRVRRSGPGSPRPPAIPERAGAQAGVSWVAAAMECGRAPATVSAGGVGQWLLTQPVFRCSSAPSVLSSRNRAVMRAGAPHWGRGWARP